MWLLYVAAAICAASMAPCATASQLVDRNASGVRLAVNGKGEALITYTAHGTLKHVLAWGAINARAPSQAQPQVAFRFDYAGGFGKYHRAYWRRFGHQIYRPVIASSRNARLLMPVADLPSARDSPVAPM